MNKKEVAILLTAISAVDDRLDPDEMRIAMWYEILDKSMPLEFARHRVIDFYANNRTVIMPSDFNLVWKTEKKKMFEKELTEKNNQINSENVPMPNEIKNLIAELLRKSRV